jgi:hypothetical protein
MDYDAFSEVEDERDNRSGIMESGRLTEAQLERGFRITAN